MLKLQIKFQVFAGSTNLITKLDSKIQSLEQSVLEVIIPLEGGSETSYRNAQLIDMNNINLDNQGLNISAFNARSLIAA